MSMLSNFTVLDSYLFTHYIDEDETVIYDYTNTSDPEQLHAHREDMISQYSYKYGDGNFSMSKTSPYETYGGEMAASDGGVKPSSPSSQLLARRVFEGGNVTFHVVGRYRMTPTTGSSAKSPTALHYSTSSSAGTDSDGDVDPEAQGVDLDTRFDMVLGDDRLSVIDDGGHTRFLRPQEYDMTTIVIPRQTPYLNYDVYVSDVGYTPPDGSSDVGTIARTSDYHLYVSGSTSSQNIVDLTNSTATGCPDGVKAVYIRFKNFKGNYYVSFDLTVSFHLDSSMPILRSDGGCVGNIGFMRIFKTGENNNILKIYRDSFSDDSFNTDVLKLDILNYNDIPEGTQPDFSHPENYELLYHALSFAYLRDFQTVLTSNTTADSRKRSHSEGEGYAIDLMSTGTIKADKLTSDNPEEVIPPTELTGFAVYLKLDKLLTIDPRLINVSLVNCSGVDILGNAVSNDVFEQNVTYRLITLDDGNRVIAAEFDFSDSPLDMSERTMVNMSVPAEILYTDFKLSSVKGFTVKSYTKLLGEGLGRISADPAGSGTTVDYTETNTGIMMAASQASKSYSTVVESWLDVGEKFVKAYEDETWNYTSEGSSWISETTVHANNPDFTGEAALRATYQYRLGFDMGLPTSDIIFADRLEAFEGSEWHGTLTSIDFTFARSLGLVPTVYYSSDETLEYTETVTDYTAVTVSNNLSDYTASPVSGDIWTAPTDDIRSIAVSFDTSGIGASGTIKSKPLYFILNMLAPEGSTNTDKYDTYALNKHSLFYTSHTSMDNRRITLVSGPARVALKPPVLFVTMLKRDNDTERPLADAQFTFYTSPLATDEYLVRDYTGEITASAVASDRFGEIRIETLEPGEYWYKETKAPAGYQLDDTVYHIVLDTEDHSYANENALSYNNSDLIINNTKLSGKILLKKRDGDITDKEVFIKGAEYTLYASDGTRLFTDEDNVYQPAGGTKSTFTTDSEGKLIITGLPWGNYYLEEITAPVGYEKNDAKIWVNISRFVNVGSQEEEGAILVAPVQDDSEKTASIRLTKYDRDGVTPLTNAWFALKKLKGDDPDAEGAWQTVPGYEYLKTARNGIIEVNDLKFGTYCFEEILAPTGYVLDSSDLRTDSVVLDASTVGTTLKITGTNERILGTAKLRKISDDGIPLTGVRFDLFMVLGENDYSPDRPANDPDDLLYRAGLITKNTAGQNAENADVIVDITSVNERKKGEVILSKTAGRTAGTYHENDPIEGAEFSLYNSDDELVPVKQSGDKYTVCGSDDTGAVNTMITGTDGKLRVDGIEWGAYYFVETKAPEGFSIADKVRFTVNRLNCLAVQELDCEDMPITCLIRIDKEIDEKLEVFGTPTFIFRVREINTGRDYTRMITLTGGAKKGTAALQVDPGTYTVEEITVGRYKLSGTEYVLESGGETATTVPEAERFIDDDRTDSKTDGKVFRFTLSSRNDVPDKAEVKFFNTLENYSGLSHTSAKANLIPTKRRLTGFSITYDNDTIECAKTEYNPDGYTLDPGKLHYTLSYDDGETEEMSSEKISLVTPASFSLDNGYANAGQSVPFTASYTEDGKTYRTTFFVTILPFKATETQKVVYRTDKDNSCYFPSGTKKSGVNIVYYNDDGSGNKTAVMGSYTEPEMLTEDKAHQYWQIIGGDDDGRLLRNKEDAVIDYLIEHYDDGLRELQLRAVLGDLIYDFGAEDEVQEFIAPKDGIYFIQGWGAQGGSCNYIGPESGIDYNELTAGGKGGYSYGYVYLREGEKVYVAVGGKGSSITDRTYNTVGQGGWNGGGNSVADGNTGWGAGGGATHFAVNNNLGELKNYSENKNDVLLVAGAGGGGGIFDKAYPNIPNKGGYGGGLTGGNGEANVNHGDTYGHGGTQTAAGSGKYRSGGFGYGGNYSDTSMNSGGGAGWYGGGSGYDQGSSGGGGSGHVNTDRLITGATIGGNEEFRSPDGTLETGHTGDGHARISYVPDNQMNMQYSGSVEKFTAPFTGYYKLEGWGAQGGSGRKIKDEYSEPYSTETAHDLDKLEVTEGGKGGYSYGTVFMKAGETIYYAVGGMGESVQNTQVSSSQTAAGGFNGGGTGKCGISPTFYNWYGGGGGATHFAYALPNGSGAELKGYGSNKDSVLLVAGGGASSYYFAYNSTYVHWSSGGAGGGETSADGSNIYTSVVARRSEIVPGSGQSPITYKNVTTPFGQAGTSGDGGAGGGWYGGLCGPGHGISRTGGSGHVNRTDVYGGETIGGDSLVPTYYGAKSDEGYVGIDSNDTEMTGNRGNGFARITYLPYDAPISYNYSGTTQQFTATVSGYYKLEAWGAEGGTAVLPEDKTISANGGKGGYSYGTVYLAAGQTVYLAVGGEGGISDKRNVYFQSGGYNGGGQSGTGTAGGSSVFSSGGGATHFAVNNNLGELKNYSDNKTDVLLAAGGGGGGSISYLDYAQNAGGYGGGYEGGDGIGPTPSGIGKGGTQTSPGVTGTHAYGQGAFGQGGNTDSDGRGSGGGGGWYGGSYGYNDGGSGGGGSGHCNDEALIERYGFATISGTETFKAPDGSLETGHGGDGYARVSFIAAPEVTEFTAAGEGQLFTAARTGRYVIE